MNQTALKTSQVYKAIFNAADGVHEGGARGHAFLLGLIHFQSGLIAFLLFAVVMTAITFAQQDIYHLVVLDRQGLPREMKELYPLDEPNLTRTAITNMATNLATQVLTYGFNNADEKLLKTKHYFTEKAWQDFVNGLLRKGGLEQTKKLQQIRTAIATNGAVIVSDAAVDGVPQWIVQVPVITTFQAGQKTENKKMTLQITLKRAPTSKYPEGVAIDRWEEL
jgi:intracellular multiplication protein IcmL